MLFKKQSLALAALAILMLPGCTNRLTDFTVISTKNVPLGNQPTDLVKATTRVKGVDRAHFILFVPLGSPNLKEAIDKAIEQYPGAIALADGVVKSKFLDFFFYGQSSYIVEGTPLYPADMKQGTGNAQGQSSGAKATETSVMRITHQVGNEKNVTELAKMYDVSVPDIMKWNKLSSPNLKSGQEIIIYLPK